MRRDPIGQFPNQNRFQSGFKPHHIPAAGIPRRNMVQQLPLQTGDPEFFRRQHLIHPLRRCTGLCHLGGESLGHQAVLMKDAVENMECPFAASHFHPGTAPEAHGGQELYQTHFAGGRHMDTTAGTAVSAGDLHDPHRPAQLLFGAVEHARQLLGRGIPAFDREIAPQECICFLLDLRQIPFRDHTIKIDGHHIRTHMKTHIVVAIAPVDDAGDDVLAGVLLHQVEAPLIINGAADFRAHFQRPITQMDHFFAPLLYIQNFHRTKKPQVAGLAAAFRIEGRGIQHHFPALFHAPAGKHPRGKSRTVAVFII